MTTPIRIAVLALIFGFLLFALTACDDKDQDGSPNKAHTVKAPEIDGSSAPAGITLLIGLLLVVRAKLGPEPPYIPTSGSGNSPLAS